LTLSKEGGDSSLPSEQSVVQDSVGEGGGETAQLGEDPVTSLQEDWGEGQALPILSNVSTATVVSVSIVPN
jgi:hypothetical protein